MPVFLALQEVLEIHQDQLSRYGGSDGIRDRGLLESALAQPAATFDGQYLHADLAEMAAVYLFHIVRNHPFVDGNKRVGAVAAVVFLAMNDVAFDAEEDSFERLVLDVAAGNTGKEHVTDFIRRHVTQ